MPKNRTHQNKTALIMGPGALGSILGRVLGQEGVDVVFVGRQKINDFWRDLDFATIENLTIYVCTPPEATDAVWEKIFLALPHMTPQKELRIVFLNNGLIPWEKMEEQLYTEALPIPFAVTRGLVLAGFMRDKDGVPRHTGGNLIYYKDLWTTPNKSQTSPGGQSFFNWQWRDDILALEVAKFFTNAMLAYFIGPTLRPNKTIDELCPEGSERQKYAEVFTERFQHIPGVSTELLLETLRLAVEGTRENINSVSKAWAEGRLATKDYFLKNAGWEASPLP